jgi:hypothetical protein
MHFGVSWNSFSGLSHRLDRRLLVPDARRMLDIVASSNWRCKVENGRISVGHFFLVSNWCSTGCEKGWRIVSYITQYNTSCAPLELKIVMIFRLI